MGSRPGFVEFVHLPTYARDTKGVLDDDDQREVERTLCSDPRAGAVIRPVAGRVYLLMFYPKNVRADLTSAQRQQMRRLTALLRTEG